MNGKLSIKAKLKTDYLRKDGTGAVYVQILYNKKKKMIPMLISVRPDQFDQKSQRVKATHPYSTEHNLLIEKTLADLNKIELNFRLYNIHMTLDAVVEEYQNPASKLDFISFWQTEMEQNQKDKLAPQTYRQQTSVLNKLRKYRSTLYFHEIDEDFFVKIKKHFLKSNKPSTVASFVKTFKKMLHIANKRGIQTPLSYDQIHNNNFVGSRAFLVAEEIAILHRYFKSEFIGATHKAILSRFLFSCFTGLRVSDIMKISQDNFFDSIMVFTAQKTGKLQRIPLTRAALEFVEMPHVFPGNFTGEYMNRELKFIAKAVGIKKNLSMHVGRHTFATNFLICGGRVEHLQVILGHSKIEETMIYVKIKDSITATQIMNMDEILFPTGSQTSGSSSN